MTKMQDMSFEKDARVVFLGDSITANGLFIAKIFDYYRTNFPERKVKMYNFGVPGDSAAGCIRMHRHELLLELQPTEIVLMFGMNDINRTYYQDDRRYDPEFQKCAQNTKEKHTERMKEIVAFLRAQNLPVTLCSSTPYDEISTVPTENLIGCQKALTDIYNADLEALSPLTLKGTVNFAQVMNQLLIELKKQELPSFIGPDRVHPNELGHDLMARIFLHAQGLLPENPTLDTLSDTLPPLSEANQSRKEAEVIWRSTAYLDFNAQWGQEAMNAEERCAYWRERLKTIEDKESYLYRCAALYPERKPNEKENFALMLQRTDEMYF